MKEISRNELLIDRLAEQVEKDQSFFQEELAIARQMRYHHLLSYIDVRALNCLVSLVRIMRDLSIFDMSHQSYALRFLGLLYADYKKRILARMDGQEDAFRDMYFIENTRTQASA